MAERNEKVLARVQQELAKEPGVSSRQLYEIAKGVDASIGKLNVRQFNAGYVLPFKRGKGGARKVKAAAKRGAGKRTRTARKKAPAAASKAPASRGSAGAGPDREKVREVLLQFARDLSKAESRLQIVDVVSNLDPYVDRLLKAAR